MKKPIALLLALILALSLAACTAAGTAADQDPVGQAASQTESEAEAPAAEAAAEDDAASGESEAEVPAEETPDDAPAFDTSWAGNDFEALIPELPFSGWTTSQPDDSTYKMELIGLNTSGATNPPDSGEPDGADKQLLLDYLNSLSACGFTVEEVGADYKWKATDALGNEVEFMCADGGCWVTIKKAN